MKTTLVVATALVLATLAWAMAPQTAGTPGQSSQQTPPSSQMPGQQQPATPGSAGQNTPSTGAQAGVPGDAANAPITEGCLGGTSPNFTITDTSGKTYKLNIPPGADPSVLTSHVGESVQVMGDVKQAGNTGSIDVTRVGKGAGKCPGSSAQPTPK